MSFLSVTKIKRAITNTAVQLILIITFSILFGSYLPYPILSALYATSLVLKEILVFTLPVIIFSSIFSCLLSFKDKAFFFIFFLFFGVTLSNFISTIFAYGISIVSLPLIGEKIKLAHLFGKSLTPLWRFEIPVFVTNDLALLSGLICGVIFSIKKVPFADKIADKLRRFVTFFLEKLFIPVLPLFALGFILKLKYEGLLEQILSTYTPILLILLVAYLFYILGMFLLAAKFNISQFLFYIKNVFPAGVMAFSSMSSMATLPLTIRAAEKNTNEPDLVRAVAPATVNTHLIGDSLAVPILALAILVSFNAPLPSFESYFIFALYLLVAKFAIAAVPGGGILVLIPLLQQYFGLNAEMSALIISMYILFDPLLAVSNVTANGAFSIILIKLFKFFSYKKTSSTSHKEEKSSSSLQEGGQSSS
ncbi:MAG: dicarboxylate/amino acid:cation symporter [Silvanigrellaceae bacterium]|nr:dicarboxylate/amino acid:cation symporter [Silvanigrellaceae bacterium]